MISENLKSRIIAKLVESVVGVKYFENKSFENILVCSGGTTFKIQHYPNCKYGLTIYHKKVGDTSFQISMYQYNYLYDLYSVKLNEAMKIQTEKNIELLLEEISL